MGSAASTTAVDKEGANTGHHIHEYDYGVPYLGT
jgi:hypothetical protein